MSPAIPTSSLEYLWRVWSNLEYLWRVWPYLEWSVYTMTKSSSSSRSDVLVIAVILLLVLAVSLFHRAPQLLLICRWHMYCKCWNVIINYIIHSFYSHDVVSVVLAMATWLGGWLDVTRRYCIKTAKPVLKLFRPPGSTIILYSFWPLRWYPIPRGTLQRGLYIHEGGKNWRFSTEISVYLGNGAW